MKKSFAHLLVESLIAILLGIALTFAFAPYELFPLAILSLAGLLALWLKKPSRAYTFFIGFCFGLGFFGAGVYWVFISMHEFGGVPPLFAVLITCGMIAFLSLYPATTGWFFTRYFPRTQTTKLLCAFPALWVFSEWLRGWLFTGFPWLFIGYTQTNSPLKGYAPLFSVYGVSLAVAVSSALIVNAIRQFRLKNNASAYYHLGGLVALWLLGFLLSLIPWTIPQGEPIKVALVQGNIPQELKWEQDHLQMSLDRYVRLTQPLWGKYQIIIWPEAAIPIPLSRVETFINELNEKAKASGSTLILGIPIANFDQTGFYNSVVTLGQGNYVYSKRHLVPFGEYIPLKALFSTAFNLLNIPVSEMVPGRNDQRPLVAGKVNLLTSICYEITFPELTRSPDKSINLLLVVTNDAWFGNSSAEPQHLQMAAMRAIEFGKPLLFVSNDGITAIIDPKGRIQASVPQRKATVLTGTVQPMYGITPWLYNGLSPIFIILIFLTYLGRRAEKVSSD